MSVFSVFGNKNKQKVNDNESHYRRLCTVSAVAKYACLILCLALVLYGFSFRTDEINADNFNYLLNYLGEGETDVKAYKTIYFDNNDTNRFSIVRGDLAVVNDSGSAVYTLAGLRRSVDSALKLDSPQVLSSAKYMYIYDLGGTDLVIKSTLETVHTVSYNYPLRGAAVTDSGYFALIGEEKTSRSSVYVYDDSFRVIYDCAYGSLYTLSVDLNDDASRLLTASVEAEGGEFLTTLYMYSLNEKEPLAKQLIAGEYPYKVAFTKNGGFMLLTNLCLRVYDGKANLVSTLEFGEAGISNYHIGDKYFIRQYSISTLSAAVKVEVYSAADGSLVWESSYNEGTRLAKSCGDNVYIASGNEMTVVSLESGKECTVQIEGETVDVLEIEEGKALVISKGMASVLDYGALLIKEGEESWAQ